MHFWSIILSKTVSREFAVTAAFCIWPPSDRRDQAIRSAIGETIDWNRVYRIVKRQRVAGLVHDGLTRTGVSVPSDFARQIRNLASDIARKNLQFAAESMRIQQMFDEAGVPVLFVKGTALAQLAYGSLVQKHSWDIDALVTPDDVPRALQLLAGAGYHAFPPLPPMTDERYKHWIRFSREYVLYHETKSVPVEIHWKLMENDYFLSGISALSPSQMVAISGGLGIRTLVEDDLFAYLCVHGATHGWSRLKWLADVAALMADDSANDAKRRLETAQKANAEDCVAQAFLLCDRLFGTPSLKVLAQELRCSYRYRWLEHIALGAMARENAETELGQAPFYKVPIFISHFMLGRGWRFALNEFWIKVNGPYDLQHAKFPNWLGFLYPLVRVASWIKRRGRMRPMPVPPKACTAKPASTADQSEEKPDAATRIASPTVMSG